MKRLIPILIAIILFYICTSAQKKSVSVEAKALPVPVKLPKPDYPKVALKLERGGEIVVPVSVDDKGLVSVEGDVTGPYPVCQSTIDPGVLALRSAASIAAQKAIFAPGQSTKVFGQIAYVFMPHGPNPKPEKTGERRLDRLTMLGSTEGLSVTKSDPQSSDGNSSKGVLNDKAVVLSKPTYPRAAKAVKVGGKVQVQVLIYEDGTVYSAQAVEGHPLLRHTAEIAACGSKFSPTLLSGKPVKVSGLITYNFVP